MTEVPKIVYDRLRAAVPAQAGMDLVHPDADLLTAFTEQGLSVEERENILQHLALCEGCREVVALALPPQESLAAARAAEVESIRALPTVAKTDRNWLSVFGWPSLRWAALAAGVIVGSALLLTRHGNPPVPLAQNSPVVAPVPAASVPATSAVQTPSAGHQPAAAEPVLQSQLAAEFGKSRGRLATGEPEAERRSRAAKVESGILIDEESRDSIRADRPVPAAPMVLNSPARESESVAVAKAAVTAQAAPATVNGLMARNEAPAIEKAKPAPQEILDQKTATQEAAANAELKAGGAASPVARSATNYAYLVKKDTLAKQAAPNFSLRISAGLLQRSVDDGVTWQAGLHTDHPLTCFVQRASEVWAGGEAGTLYHSLDGGVTWAAVKPAINAQSLTTDIVDIKLRAGTVFIYTRDNETWTTRDGGQTLERQ